MIVESDRNPYLDSPLGNPLLLGIAEVPFAAASLKKSIEQRETGVDTGQAWLTIAQGIGRVCNVHDVFPTHETEDATIDYKVGAGFATSTFAFTTTGGKWVLKLGSGDAPLPGWLNPSSEQYASWYAHHLDILNATFNEPLPHVIPSPQYVMHSENDSQQKATLIIQPLIESAEPLSSVYTKDEDSQTAILEELEVFYTETEHLRQRHQVIPDLGFDGNLVIAQKEDGYHLVLLDNGLVDYRSISPLVNAYLTVRYHLGLRGTISRLRRSLK